MDKIVAVVIAGLLAIALLVYYTFARSDHEIDAFERVILWVLGGTLVIVVFLGWLYTRMHDQIKHLREKHLENHVVADRRAVERHAATHEHLVALGRDVRAGDAATHARMDRELGDLASDMRDVKTEQGGVRRGIAAIWGATSEAFKDWLNKPKKKDDESSTNSGGSKE